MQRKRNIVWLIAFVFLVFQANAQIANQPGKRIIKVLAIGNSFSEDAVEFYLSDLLKADSVQAIIGSLVIGGYTLEQQWGNVISGDSLYRYTKINWKENGRLVEKKTAILDAIHDEDWDYITFQQVSHQSGIYKSYFPYIKDLLGYAKAQALNPDVQFALHQTWAYDKTSTHYGFANYNKDQQEMFNAIVHTVDQVARETGIEIIIPAGVSIQKCREALPTIDFCRDGFHLSQLGRYAAACTWYEKLFGESILNNTFYPTSLDKENCDVIKEVVHRVVHGR